MDLNVLRDLSYGVYIVSTTDNGRAVGCTANSAMQITSSPASIAVSINKNNFTHECIEKTGVFSISILSEKSDSGLIGTFGFNSGRENHKFMDVDFDMVNGVPCLNDSCGYIICKVTNKMDTATHTVFLGEVIDAVKKNDCEPMTYAYYHRVLKGSSPEMAPTYIPVENIKTTDNKKRFKCTVCGYIYEGDELPENYICPICKQGSDKFEEI